MKKPNTTHITIATVFFNLLNKNYFINSEDEALVVEALRRSNNSLSDASLPELGEYLSTMNSEQLKGLGNNIKGIFHELKYVENFNAENDDLYAELFGDTNHAGSDVVIRDSKTHEIVEELQLKATDSSSYVAEHISRYPDIDVAATCEVADKIGGIRSTGISNAEITQSISEQFDQLDSGGAISQLGDSVAVSGLLAGALRASQVMSGKKDVVTAGKEALVDIGIATSTTALVALLFS